MSSTLKRDLERHWNSVPPGESRARALGARLRAASELLLADARGWPMRRQHAARVHAMVERLLPWEEGAYQSVLLDGFLEGRTVPSDPHEAPLVSVVIPVYGKLDFTVRCLLAVGATEERTRFEVIVVDDGSPDATEAVLSRCPGIRYFRNAKNGGFIESCNRGAAEARGRFVHLLNNDTVVLPGWLDRLVETFERFPEAGLVGSKLVYPSLVLQEAGGIVWRDASASNYGNGHDPWNPRLSALRDVDYCSAASVLVPTELFRAIGGFDVRFKPAYYEDTDLAFAVRAHGKRVLYQPTSVVLHYEGVTSGKDVSTGPKKHQLTNQAMLRAKWADVLDRHGVFGDTSARELDRRSRGHILVVGSQVPTPDRDSGSIDLVNLLSLLRAMDYAVTYLAALPIPRGLGVPNVRGYVEGYTEALQAVGVEVPYFPYETSVERFLAERGAELDAVVLVRGRIADRFLGAVRRHAPRAKVIFDTVDLHYLREEREAAHRASLLYAIKAKDSKRRELRVTREADATLVLSQVEEALLAREVPSARVRILPLLRTIPGRQTGFDGRHGVLFVGGFRHRPNVDAVEHLVRDVWPLVRARRPDLVLHVVGADTPASIRALAASDIVVHGHVPDLAAMLAAVRLTVAPLRFGAGLKGKVAESLGHGVPCIATSIGVEGSSLVDGTHVVVADGADAIADAIVTMHDDRARWERLSDAGLAFVNDAYSLEANARRIAALFAELGVSA